MLTKKNAFLILFMGIGITNITAQPSVNDTIIKMSGEKIAVKILSNIETSISYVWPGESITNAISKNQIEQIIYSSGRKEIINKKNIINGENDWEQVRFTTLESDVEGLVKKGDLDVSTKNMGLYTPQKKAELKLTEQIKKQAAVLGAQIIFLTHPFKYDARYQISGVAYGYK